jgi:hypothetical protein
VVHSSQRGPAQAAAAEDRLAGGGPGRLRRRHAAPHNARRIRLEAPPVPAAGNGELLGRRQRRRRAPLRSRQDTGGRRRDGHELHHHPDPGHQHGVRDGSGRTSFSSGRPSPKRRSANTPAPSRRSVPVTIATYQVLTTKRGGLYPHLELVDGNDWGLIIYDEVHLLPAPIFRMTADLQARRRLGLTATLVREDGREGEVFSLIGPKRYDAPWKDIEAQGYIAPADCVEVRSRPAQATNAWRTRWPRTRTNTGCAPRPNPRPWWWNSSSPQHAGRAAAGDRAVHRPAGRDSASACRRR